eukprot:SAG31_NODE_442_length_15661_cov_4.132245_12_plen_90_part_00
MSGACGALLTIQYLIYDLRTAGLAMVEDDAQLWQRPLRIFFTPARWVGMNTVREYVDSAYVPCYEFRFWSVPLSSWQSQWPTGIGLSAS